MLRMGEGSEEVCNWTAGRPRRHYITVYCFLARYTVSSPSKKECHETDTIKRVVT